jgi:hypothetical protein
VVRTVLARRNEVGDYEIRTVTREAEAYLVTGGVFPREGFEERYERASPNTRATYINEVLRAPCIEIGLYPYRGESVGEDEGD